MNKASSKNTPQAAWQWRISAPPSEAGRMPRSLRALIQFLIIAGVATLFLLIGHRYRLSLFLYCLSAVVLISGLLIPVAFNAFEQFGQWLGKIIGGGITWGLLTLFFCLCVVPARLILMLSGKDPLQRHRDPQARSYWSEHKPTDSKFYTRQY